MDASHDHGNENESAYLLKQFYLNALLNIDSQHQMDNIEEKVNCLHRSVIKDKSAGC